MRKTLFILTFFLVVAALSGLWQYKAFQAFAHTPLDLGDDGRVLQIPQGMHAKGVVDLLQNAGIIEHRWMMLYILKDSGLAERIQPGTVVLKNGIIPTEIPKLLARVGDFARLSIQILPGMNLYEIAERMHENRVADKTVFLQMATDPAFAADFGVPASTLEGYLAPGAYTFDPGTTTHDVLLKLHSRWRDNWTAIVAENRGAYEAAVRRNFNDHALITLASIVEKEAILDAERPIIARVFYNRIQKKMMLQSDPTCVYPPKEIGEKPTPKRCKDPNNPYSTYVIKGLPPGPIDSPSAASMRAVLKPFNGPDANALFYFTAKQDGSKKHYFSKTYAEHQKAVDFFLKKSTNRPPKGTPQPQ